jgi:two-component system, sensor histidine kinase
MALIGAGALILLLSFRNYTRIIESCRTDDVRHRWEILLMLTVFFLIGYVGQIMVEYLDALIDLSLLIGAVYFFGAVYVYLVVSQSWTTINLLQERETAMLKGMDDNEKSRKTLQEKVEELEKLQKLTMQRERRIIELKERIRDFEAKDGKTPDR